MIPFIQQLGPSAMSSGCIYKSLTDLKEGESIND